MTKKRKRWRAHAGLGWGAHVSWQLFVGFNDVAEFEVLANLRHLLDDGVVARVSDRNAPALGERFGRVYIVRPESDHGSVIECANQVARPCDPRRWVRWGVLDFWLEVLLGLHFASLCKLLFSL